MVRLGRRGDLSMIYEMVISLLLIIIFLLAVFPFIWENASGEIYFSRFYAADLATNAELVNAAYGDVVLRYDNLKQNLDLTFWLDNGLIVIGRLPEEARRDNAAFVQQVPPQATGHYYGKAKRYATGMLVTHRPAFLVLRKFDGAFAITEAETNLKDCPVTEPAVRREDAKIALTVEGHNAELVEARTKALLQEINLPVAEDANIRISIAWNNGNSNSIETQPTSIDGRAFSCLFARRLHSLTLIQFEENQPSSSGTAFDVKMALSTSSAVTEEQVAQAIANALAVYYR